MIADTVIRAGEVVATDIVLYEPLPATLAFNLIQDFNVTIWANEIEALSGADSNDIIVGRMPVAVLAPAADGYLKVWIGGAWVVKSPVIFRTI